MGQSDPFVLLRSYHEPMPAPAPAPVSAPLPPAPADQDTAPAKASNAKEDRHFVTALARGLDVLRAFKSGEERLSNRELAERCALPKSTGTMVALAIRDDLSMLYLENCRSEHSVLTLRLGIGSRMPLATSAAGRGYMAGAPEPARVKLEARMQALDPAAWPAHEAGIRQAQADLAEHGCVTSFGDWRPDVNAIAVPFKVSESLPLMVVNAAAAAIMISPQAFMQDVRPQLLDTVQRITTRYRAGE